MFLSRRWRPNKWPFYGLLVLELPLTVLLLALFGIAAPDLYRDKLWQDGANNGFNSAPNAGAYAAANYRPYTIPKVWSQFITNFNIVISVLSMFLMLVKAVMYMLHCFPPILSAFIHALLISLYAVSINYQTSSDMTDPRRPQPGAPWYITKPCSVTLDPSNKGYCVQAKASFAGTVAMTGVFVMYCSLSIWSCFPSKKHREEYAERQRAKEERYPRYQDVEEEEEEESQYQYSARPVQGTPGMSKYQLMTPRTLTFNKLGGTTGLSMREEKQPAVSLTTHPVRSLSGDSDVIEPVKQPSTMFFPPPPKRAMK